MSNVKFSDLVGQKILKVKRKGDESITFHTDRAVYLMYHDQDCCEDVTIKEVDNDLQKMIGARVISAELTTNEGQNGWESFTWSFYKIATDRGDYFTISWLGESNGYYNEEVDFKKVD